MFWHMTRRIAEWIALIVLVMLSVTFWTDFAQASEDSVALMIEERAAAELGATLPDDSRIEIRLAAGAIETGNFVQEFWMDPKTGQFIANIMTDYGMPQRVWGVAVVTIEVPVPTRLILPDEIITADDITGVEMPVQRLGTFAVRSAEDVVGKQVRRMLAAVGHPVKKLERVAMGPVRLTGLPRGAWRELSRTEVESLRRAVRRGKAGPTDTPRKWERLPTNKRGPYSGRALTKSRLRRRQRISNS